MKKTEVIVSISAVVISLISLFATISFSKKAQEHNVKSVLPIPYIIKLDFEDRLEISIYNKGTGPLIAKKLVASTNGNIGYMIDLIPATPDGFTFSNFSRFIKQEHRILRPGEHHELLKADFDVTNPNHMEYRQLLKSHLKNFKIHLTYTDVYDSQFDEYTTDCEWFGR